MFKEMASINNSMKKEDRKSLTNPAVEPLALNTNSIIKSDSQNLKEKQKMTLVTK